jgi:hypothetical protein
MARLGSCCKWRDGPRRTILEGLQVVHQLDMFTDAECTLSGIDLLLLDVWPGSRNIQQVTNRPDGVCLRRR